MSEQAITVLLQRVKAGEKDLMNSIYTRLYADIKKIAQFQINKLNTGETITPTVLAHDCYLKLIKQNQINVKDRGHFLNCLSISMRQILVDAYRAKASAKRLHIDTDKDFAEITGNADIDFKIMELDLLLNKVEKINVRYSEILNYKIILSMTFPEIAQVTQLSERQVIRIWNQAKTLLMALAHGEKSNGKSKP